VGAKLLPAHVFQDVPDVVINASPFHAKALNFDSDTHDSLFLYWSASQPDEPPDPVSQALPAESEIDSRGFGSGMEKLL
jgi:hypothetical protein